MSIITDLTVIDLRFPTSRELAGSDAMNLDPDYSAAYVVLRIDDGPDGHGLTFTIGRGTEVVCAGVRALRPLVVGQRTQDLFADMGRTWRHLVGDSQLRWIGPEKGAIHLATAAVVNALWDLYGKVEGKPVWRLLADMTPRQVVDLVDWRYLTDALTPDEALDLLTAAAAGKADRTAEMETHGLPAYTTSAGWLGYDDEKLRSLCAEAVEQGWSHVKLKVGGDLDNDVRRCRIARDILGDDRTLMLDANQTWDVGAAVAAMERLSEFRPWWIEEPTSPDDVLGHRTIAGAVAPVLVATGEHLHNRVMFKQFLAGGAMGICQVDACRLGGVNEVVAVLLLAAKFGVPVCPHAGGVGLCELVQHLSAFNYASVAPSLDDVVVEYVDHLHEHFVDPVCVKDGRYLLPEGPGYSAQVHWASLERFRYPDGAEWSGRAIPVMRR